MVEDIMVTRNKIPFINEDIKNEKRLKEIITEKN